MPATAPAIRDWSPRRLNHLIAARGYRHYLEIGVLRGVTFHAVQVPERIAVDPDFRFDWRTSAKTGAA